MYLLADTHKASQNAGPFSVARLKMDPPFHNRLMFTGEVPALLVLHGYPRCPALRKTCPVGDLHCKAKCFAAVMRPLDQSTPIHATSHGCTTRRRRLRRGRRLGPRPGSSSVRCQAGAGRSAGQSGRCRGVGPVQASCGRPGRADEELRAGGAPTVDTTCGWGRPERGGWVGGGHLVVC